MNTYTLTALARSSWSIPRVLETVRGVKTNKTGEVATELYARHPDCREVAIRKEEKKHEAAR